MDQPTAEDALARLDVLVGAWTIEATWPHGSLPPGSGRSSFEWHESGAHLVQRSTIDLAEAPDSTSIIGCDAANGTYTQLYADERGVCRTYAMSLDDRAWKLWREGPPFDQRFAATIEDGGNTLTGGWQIAEDGDFRTDFDLVYRRVVA